MTVPESLYAARIIGTGSAFPSKVLTNKDLEGITNTTEAWIIERTGIRERRISESGNQQEFNSSLGLQASLKALEMAGKRPEDIDQILYATCTPETLIPSTACWLQKKLSADRAWCIDLNAACSGFVFGVSTAESYIRSGKVKTSLVVGADILSAFTNWDDRSSCILFGDGAGAVVIEQTQDFEGSRILHSELGTDGQLWDLFHIPAGGSQMETTPDAYEKNLHKMHMKGKEIFKIAVKTLAEYALKAIKACDLTLDEIDWFIPHQANLRIIEAVAKRLELPLSKVIVNLDRYGNTSSATCPTALDGAVRDGRIQKGDLLLFDVFGAGLTYGAMVVRW